MTIRAPRVLLFVASMTAAPAALAYLDPGTGSFVLQMLIAGLLGAVLYVKMAWANTKEFLARMFAGKSAVAPTDDEEPGESDEPR